MVTVRPLAASDLAEGQRIVRRAFGTFLGAPDPDDFWTDFDYVYGRHGAEHVVSFAAEQDGTLAGLNFATRWGSVGFFGPIATRPELWNRGIAQPLVAAVSGAFDAWGVTHAGLCTIPHSTKHAWLYQKFGFYPRFITPVMAAPVPPDAPPPAEGSSYAALAPGERAAAEAACRALTEAVYPGLDIAAEIRTVAARGLGDTVLVWDKGGRLAAFAVCHWGPASEAGEGCLFVKFGAALPGAEAEARFAALLDACASRARAAGMKDVVAGVNTGREEAYRHMMGRGFRSRIHVITMHRPNAPCYSRPGDFVLDDWR